MTEPMLVVRGLHALLLVRLHELAEVLERDADADPGLVHGDGVDAGLAEAAASRDHTWLVEQIREVIGKVQA